MTMAGLGIFLPEQLYGNHIPYATIVCGQITAAR